MEYRLCALKTGVNIWRPKKSWAYKHFTVNDLIGLFGRICSSQSVDQAENNVEFLFTLTFIMLDVIGPNILFNLSLCDICHYFVNT